MLILFDVDGTLLRTEGAGILAMRDAGRELFGDDFDHEGVEFAGRIDPLIWRDLARGHGIADPEAHHEAFRKAYARHLTRRLASESRAIALPGVRDLLDSLSDFERITMGLLTGNYSETGRIKLTAAGLDPDQFPIRAWGGEATARRDLPPRAMAQYHERLGRLVPPESVLIIGDTPHDIDCAKHHRCSAFGVATGRYSRADLEAAGADHVFDDLGDTSEVLDRLLHAFECGRVPAE